VVSSGLMEAEVVAQVLSPERLSGMVPVTGAIAITLDD
jgi:aspartate ammonia-lyase